MLSLSEHVIMGTFPTVRAYSDPAWLTWHDTNVPTKIRLLRKREPTTTLANLTQIMCVGVLKHVRKDTKGHGWEDHLAREAAPEVER